MVESKKIAVIPARGGSKRLPKKNIIDFEGKPMIAWTIEAAFETGIFDKVLVSTDSPEIKHISEHWGASVPFLRDEKADDYSTVSEATVRALQQLIEIGEEYDQVVQLFSVCPLRNSTDILNAMEYFENANTNFLLSCFKFQWMNPWAAMTLNDKGEGERIFKGKLTRSQDKPDLFAPTGAIWMANVNNLLEEKSFYGKGHLFWEMNWKRAVDIDDYDDLELAKAIKRIL